MKNFVLIILISTYGLTVGAQEKGIHFEHQTTWEKVLEKAKAENKFIFVDCFTTWCGPCKFMSSKIFPLDEIGRFYNEKFINVKLQLDKTEKDNDEVKEWYKTGDDIANKYKVNAYPTYLFFDPKGSLVHRSVGTISDVVAETSIFLQTAKDALNPEKQYYTLKQKFEYNESKGIKQKPEFLYNLVSSAAQIYDIDFGTTVLKKYILTQKNLFTKENVSLLTLFCQSSKDEAFKLLFKNVEKIDPAFKKEVASKINAIIFREEIMPKLSAKNAAPDWQLIETNLKTKYPLQTKGVLSQAKVMFFENKKDWKNFGQAVIDYIKLNNDLPSLEINNLAWSIFEHCDDTACISKILELSKKAVSDDPNHLFMDTYANLLYKIGKNEEAIEWESKAMNLAKSKNEDYAPYEETISKMKKGEKTW